MGERSLQPWSQSDWIIFLGSQGPTIREIVECLGLLHINDRGEPKFSERELRRLSSEVQRLSRTLPTEPEALLRSAVDPKALDEELNVLLSSHGAAIWGEASDRKRLLIAAKTSKTSPRKELFFEVPADKMILKTHLHRWIYKKAHTSIGSREPTKQSAECKIITSSGDNAAQSAESGPAQQSVGSLHDEALTISSISPPAHAFNQRDAFVKRKANLVDSVSNDGGATKRMCQDTATSVDQPLQEPVSTLRRGSERVNDFSRGDACLSHPAVHNVAATSTRPSMSSGLPSHHTQNGISRLTCSPTSTFVAINRVPTDCPITTDTYCPTSTQCPTSTHIASTLSEISSLPVASIIPSSVGQVRASSSSNNQCQGRHGTTKSAQTLGNSSPHAGQVTLHSRRLSQDSAARMLPSPPAESPESHHTMGHNTDQRHNVDRSQAPVPRDASFEQCDLLWLLLRYLFPRVGETIKVPLLLRSLEHVWATHEQDFRLVTDQHFDCHRNVLFIWICERRKTIQLQSMIDRQPSAQTLEMVDRVLVMNDLRILRLKWKALKVHGDTQHSAPEDLLCSTFAIMTRTKGTEALFKEGLDRLKESSPEVGGPDSSVIAIYS